MIYKNKRSEIEILDTILAEANAEVKKTHLLYMANVSYAQFSDYFEFLLSHEFLSVVQDEPTQKTYTITEKGRSFHECIRSILAMTKEK